MSTSLVGMVVESVGRSSHDNINIVKLVSTDGKRVVELTGRIYESESYDSGRS